MTVSTDAGGLHIYREKVVSDIYIYIYITVYAASSGILRELFRRGKQQVVPHRASQRAFRFVSACRRRFTSEVTTRQMTQAEEEEEEEECLRRRFTSEVRLAPRESDRARRATNGALL